MTLSPGEKIQPNLSTLRSPAGLSAAGTSSHWAEHLNVANGTEAETFGNPRLDQFDNAPHRSFWIVHLHEIKIAVTVRFAQIGDAALVDTVRADDDLTFGRLSEHLDEPHHRYGAGTDCIDQYLARANRRQLVDIPH